MYKRRPLNHLNNWHSCARLFAERLRCAYYVVHTITTAIVLKMQSTSAHVSFECMLFELSQDDMERTHRKTNALAFRTFCIHDLLFSLIFCLGQKFESNILCTLPQGGISQLNE